ncbi:MAG TPA: MlaD family protein [Verrucomicrobiota bacterium]|nr:MlaD family protein [Verrucomicrobiota bacterium]HNU51188.1 MlaD family protein [Verrucomicrobiota bacterium]
MSQKANPTSIGLFLVIGLALGVLGLITFSSGKLFRTQHRYILYFDASLKGLNPGAPVKLRGVTVGSVAEVLITHNQARTDFSMPVIIDIDRELFAYFGLIRTVISELAGQ